MLATRLILVDGIPASGKSTTAQWIALELRKRKVTVDWFMDEHRGNPVTNWDALGTNQFIQKTYEMWDGFSQAISAANTVMVLEGCLFQHFMARLLAEDIQRDEIRRCILTVGEMIRPLQPALIYYDQADVALALKTFWYAERGTEWSDYMLAGLESSPYATGRHLTGFSALTAYYQEFQTLAHQLLQDLGIRTLTIENTARAWPTYREQIQRFLSLPAVVEEPISPNDLKSFVGRYRDWSGSHPENPECRIQLENDRLIIYDFRYHRSPLIPKAPGEFYVETLGYELFFEIDEQARTIKMKVGGKEPSVGIGPITLLEREFHRIVED